MILVAQPGGPGVAASLQALEERGDRLLFGGDTSKECHRFTMPRSAQARFR